MQNILLSQLDRENKRLNECGDLLLTIKVNEYDLHNHLERMELLLEFDSVSDALNRIYQAVIECGSNKEMLIACVEFISGISLMVATLTSKILEFQNNLQWNS